ncbi:hypothetical protein BJV78DRAFT_1250475 [Lactifluus subvellereus]|nr:hypothetical protein BJV78DRAFT_1250475 [Lactifluus subvellereus]
MQRLMLFPLAYSIAPVVTSCPPPPFTCEFSSFFIAHVGCTAYRGLVRGNKKAIFWTSHFWGVSLLYPISLHRQQYR